MRNFSDFLVRLQGGVDPKALARGLKVLVPGTLAISLFGLSAERPTLYRTEGGLRFRVDLNPISSKASVFCQSL